MQVLVGGVTQPQPELEIVYESYKQWVFKHPNDTSLAYETGIADDGVNTPDTYLTEFEKTLLKKLTKKQKEKMTKFDKELYKAKRKEQLFARDVLAHSLQEGDKYKFPL